MTSEEKPDEILRYSIKDVEKYVKIGICIEIVDLLRLTVDSHPQPPG